MSDTANLFLLAGIWSLIAIAVVWFIPTNWTVRIGVLALLVGVPFWELPYGFYNFAKICKEGARLIAYDAVVPQDSICVENLDSGMYAGLVKAGFARIEVTGNTDDPKRDAASGKVFFVKKREIKSSYCLGSANNIELPWRILRDDALVIRASDQRVIGRQSQYLWFGMWWQDKARPVFGRGGMCYDDPQRPSVFIRTGAI